MYDTVFDEVLALLLPLERVTQSRRHHPEGDALFHSLQVYGLARETSEGPALWATALLHDVGKAAVCSCHAEQGAGMLEGIADDRVRWLVAHHLELLRWDTRLVQGGWLRQDPAWPKSAHTGHARRRPYPRFGGEAA